VVGVDLEPAPAPVALFNGASPGEVITAATDAANQLADIVRQRQLSKRIGAKDHILVEGWQTLGSIVGVFAIKDGGVRELPWPVLAGLGEEPEDRRTAAHAAWDQHRRLLARRDMGLAYGFSASYRAVKDGREVGWGESRCTRSEDKWIDRDDYALSSMSQTRGLVRTLKQPLGWIVTIAGYSATPAEELDSEPAAVAAASPYGALVDDAGDLEAAAMIDAIFTDVDGNALVRITRNRFQTEHLPDAAAKMLAAIKWALGTDAVRAKAPEDAPPDPDASAYHGAPPDG